MDATPTPSRASERSAGVYAAARIPSGQRYLPAGVPWAAGRGGARLGLAHHPARFKALAAVVVAIAVLVLAPAAVAEGGPTGYSACAVEGSSCSLPALSDVAFGANGSFLFAYGANYFISCSNAAFGSDPAPGVQKTCYAKPDVAPAGYVFCAAEGQTCSPPVPATVAFGATGTYLYQSLSAGGISCTNARFRNDPVPGVPKDCYFEPVLGTTEGQTLSTQISADSGATALLASDGCTINSISVNWGDGSTSTGSSGPPTATGTAIYGTHSYQEGGTYTGSVTWQEACIALNLRHARAARPRSRAADPTSAFIVHVADPPLSLTPIPLAARAGAPFTRVLALLNDADTTAPSSEYSAIVQWGDGTSTRAVVAPRGTASFTLTGSHTYPHAGVFSVTVAVSDTGGATATTPTIAIAASPLRPPCDPARGCVIAGSGPPRCTVARPCAPPVPPPTLTPTPQLCGPLSTLPWSHCTPCTIKATTTRNQTEIVISNPVVDRPEYVYSAVVFKPGDVITIRAGGCVQTGGHGKTWKRYVNPSGPNSGPDWPGLYHGTVFIPAGLLNGQTVTNRSISDVIDRTSATPIEIPAPPASGPPQPLSQLTLGYRDDDPPGRSDDGYYAHNGDEGTNHQCPTRGDDGGNAWVVIDVVHGPPHPPPSPPPPKAFDLVATSYDANGAAVNPVWGWQIPGTPELGRDYNRISGHYEEDCGVLAPPQPKPNGPPRPIQIAARNGLVLYHPWPQNPAPASCTNQTTEVNPSGASEFLGSVFGLCRNADGMDAGHLNWGEATYTGTITWRPGSPSTDPTKPNYREVLEWSGGMNVAIWTSGDNDYNLSLLPPVAPRAPYLSGVTPPEEGSIGLEFLSNETVDQFSGAFPWWNALHTATDGTLALSRTVAAEGNQWLINHLLSHRIVVLGTMGLDLVHGSPASEIHPVHALAIEENSPDATSPASDVPPADPASDTWAFFIRNWGNEGGCASEQVNLSERRVVLPLSPPPGFTGRGAPGERPEVTWQSALGGGASTARVGVNADGTAALIADLPDPDQHGWVAGEVTLRWPGAGAAHPTLHPRILPPAPGVRCGATLSGANGEPGPEATMRVEYNALSATQRRVYRDLVPRWLPNVVRPASHRIPLALSDSFPTPSRLQPGMTLESEPRDTANMVAQFNALAVAGAARAALGANTPCAVAKSVLRPLSVLAAPGEPAVWRAPKPVSIQRRLSKPTIRELRQRIRSCR
jgi:hypothetical protein